MFDKKKNTREILYRKKEKGERERERKKRTCGVKLCTGFAPFDNFEKSIPAKSKISFLHEKRKTAYMDIRRDDKREREEKKRRKRE